MPKLKFLVQGPFSPPLSPWGPQKGSFWPNGAKIQNFRKPIVWPIKICARRALSQWKKPHHNWAYHLREKSIKRLIRAVFLRKVYHRCVKARDTSNHWFDWKNSTVYTQKALFQCVWVCASWDFELERKNSYTAHKLKCFSPEWARLCVLRILACVQE